MEVDVDPQEEQIEELKQDKNMYWKIIVSLQHKIQSLVKSVEYNRRRKRSSRKRSS